jgi:hypothetical protein
MRQHPLLRWIEQAEARKATDAAFHERAMYVRTEHTQRHMLAAYRRPRLLWPLLRRLSPFGAAKDLC